MDETPPPEKPSLPIAAQIGLLFIPMVLGVVIALSSSTYDGLTWLLLFTVIGVIAAGIWTGAWVMRENSADSTGIKILQFIGGFILGGLAYLGIAWAGCMIIVSSLS